MALNLCCNETPCPHQLEKIDERFILAADALDKPTVIHKVKW